MLIPILSLIAGIHMSSTEQKTSSSNLYEPPAGHILHSSFGHPLTKQWNVERSVQAEHICYPIFVHELDDVVTPIESLPGQSRWGIPKLSELLTPLVAKGLRSVILFGVVNDASKKDAKASFATDPQTPVLRAIEYIKKNFPSLLIMTDVCLCAYTSHGHCGFLTEEGHIDNQPSINRLAEMATAHALAGAHVVAPSDMMDGRIGAIKAALRVAGKASQVSVMAYSSKFASCFYGPFRDAAGSGCKFGNRGSYQLPPGSRGLAIRAAERDIEEGADFVMVKPGGPYLDIVRDVANVAEKKGIPVAIYHVSGEYAMLYWGAKHGAFNLEEAVMESLLGMRRAGATVLITYYADLALDAVKKVA